MGVLTVRSTPEGAQLRVDGRTVGQAPGAFDLPAGKLELELSKPGYASWRGVVNLVPGSTVSVTGILRDTAPPVVRLGELPARFEQGAELPIQAQAEDNERVAVLALWIDGQRHAETTGEPLSYLWDTGGTVPGPHAVRVEAWDPAGNLGQGEARIELFAPPSPVPSPEPTPQVRVTSVAPATRAVAIQRGTLTVPTYQYQQALREDPANPAYPYPALDHPRVGPPLPVVYETIILENEYLRLVFLPALGGRLYQCTFLPTGQNVFYNNAVLKPSHWGPPEMGWWLAAGGVEWCLPVDEHGYVTAQPWAAETARHADGSATVTLTHHEQTRNIRAQVAVTLAPGQASFDLSSRLDNPDAQPKTFQYWLNAMISLGSPSLSPATRFTLPVSEVIVHSTGDSALGGAHATLPWPFAGGRDLSRYENWPNWLGVFAPAVTAGFAGAYNPETNLGIVRIFPRGQAPGVKLFAFGRDFGGRASYTDDGSAYAELWGGLTPTFWDWATLPAQGSIQWTETWFPVAGLGGLSYATKEAALAAAWDGHDLQLAVAVARPRDVVVNVSDEGGELYRQTAAVSPERPFVATVRPPRAVAGKVMVRVGPP